ncbi:hypothetical protein [Kitasatospora sp. MBT63]|uniref:hypothetical protein n=1 Tax=Kitasatospora sp. MBT63 TaxID=1444768 RepID=UPI00069152D9|nr:hypothetical protein [Kitasatospora sp. MBT63]
MATKPTSNSRRSGARGPTTADSRPIPGPATREASGTPNRTEVHAARPHGPFGRVVTAEIVPSTLRNSPIDPELLRTFLLGLVPLMIAEQQGATPEHLEAGRDRCVELITSYGDELQFGGSHRAASRTALAKAFALLARQPGGITAFGVHACTSVHEYCPGNQPTPDTHAYKGNDGRP